jgi:hypothetical protein
MSMIVDEDFKRWTVKRKAALVMDIVQGKTSISEASLFEQQSQNRDFRSNRSYDLSGFIGPFSFRNVSSGC